MTSRPTEDADSLTTKSLVRVHLKPLTQKQQDQIVTSRLAAANMGARAHELIAYIRSTLPEDAETKETLTSNPLMLSLVISYFELKGGKEMPTTRRQLYRSALSTLLERVDRKTMGTRGVAEASGSAELEPLLRALSLDAHAAKRKLITEADIERVVSATPQLGSAWQRARRLLQQGKMPLMGVLQRFPLVVVLSHLSFQEFFVEEAICAGAELSEKTVWGWDVWWAGVLSFGTERREAFSRGLARSVGFVPDFQVRRHPASLSKLCVTILTTPTVLGRCGGAKLPSRSCGRWRSA